MKYFFNLIFTVFIFLCSTITAYAYDRVENCETGTYWALKDVYAQYDIPNPDGIAQITEMNGVQCIKLLRPGNVEIICYVYYGLQPTVYSIVLHVVGDPVDGSQINARTYRQEVLNFVNSERKKRNLTTLKLADDLCDYAAIRAKEISMKFSHTRPDGSECFSVMPQGSYLFVGENIAYGYPTPKTVVKAWMDSPEHRANILNPRFKEMGVSYYYVVSSNEGSYWAQFFRK